MQKIRAARLLLVEGSDKVNLFRALICHSLVDNPDIQVIDAGGKDKFRRNLKAIQTAALAGSDLQAVGVVRDADGDAGRAFDLGVVHGEFRPLRAAARAESGNRVQAVPDVP